MSVQWPATGGHVGDEDPDGLDDGWGADLEGEDDPGETFVGSDPLPSAVTEPPRRTYWVPAGVAVVLAAVGFALWQPWGARSPAPAPLPPPVVAEAPATVHALAPGTCTPGTDVAPLLDVTGIAPGATLDVTLYYDPTGKGKGSPSGKRAFTFADGDGCYWLPWVLQTEPGAYTFVYDKG